MRSEPRTVSARRNPWRGMTHPRKLSSLTPWKTRLIASASSFSSTVLVFKALTEWGHSSLPHGRRAIGILLFQDVALIPLLLLVPLLTGRGESAGPWAYVLLVLSSVLFVAAVIVLRYVLAKWIIPLFASYRSPELIVLFTLVSLGGVTFLAYAIGLPAAIGAFAAGRSSVVRCARKSSSCCRH